MRRDSASTFTPCSRREARAALAALDSIEAEVISREVVVGVITITITRAGDEIGC